MGTVHCIWTEIVFSGGGFISDDVVVAAIDIGTHVLKAKIMCFII